MTISKHLHLDTSTIHIPHLNLHETLQTGQCFRWYPKDGGYIGVIEGNVFSLQQREDMLSIKTNAPKEAKEILSSYFQLSIDLPTILAHIATDAYTKRATTCLPGLRVLRQPIFETCVSFIISSCNNVKRIQRIIEDLCNTYGSYIGHYDTKAYFAFPTPQQLLKASVSDLQRLGLGYRARYMYESTRMFCENENEMTHLHQYPYEKAREVLLRFPGIGKKVADCILLYAYGFHNAYPIDVWVGRVTNELYKDRIGCSCKGENCRHIEQFAQTYFHGYAGWAQLYLFHYRRTRGVFSEEK